MNLIVYFPFPLLCPLSLPLFFLSLLACHLDLQMKLVGTVICFLVCVLLMQYATLISIYHLMHISVIPFIQLLVLKSGLIWVLADKYCTLQAMQLMLSAKLELAKEKIYFRHRDVVVHVFAMRLVAWCEKGSGVCKCSVWLKWLHHH